MPDDRRHAETRTVTGEMTGKAPHAVAGLVAHYHQRERIPSPVPDSHAIARGEGNMQVAPDREQCRVIARHGVPLLGEWKSDSAD
jgi:hypothetical protein